MNWIRLLAPLAALFVAAPAGAADWCQFRGPNGQGHAETAGLPVKWTEHDGIAWKTTIPGLGWSSPVVGQSGIWLTTAIERGRSLRALCVDPASGRIKRDVEVFAPARPVSVNPKNSYASPSPVVEPERVYVHFGAMGTACLDASSGAIVWKNEELVVDHKEGPGSSPIVFGNLLIVNCDGQDRQYVAALDKATGKAVWKTKRSAPMNANPDFCKAFSTPSLMHVAGRTELVSTGADQVNAYDPQSGTELWRVRYRGFSNVPVPIVDGDRVYVVTDFSAPQLWAIRAGGQGDVTDTHVLWKLARQVGASPSPVLVGRRLYLVADKGVVSCVDADNGKLIWQRRLGGSFSASPVFLGGHLYLSSEQGQVTVLRPADECQIVAVNQLPGRILATPAVVDRALLLRTDAELYRIEAK